eukprot:SAG31_NODE_26327_length_444_cov_0.866667_1_plen_37_part_10
MVVRAAPDCTFQDAARNGRAMHIRLAANPRPVRALHL